MHGLHGTSPQALLYSCMTCINVFLQEKERDHYSQFVTEDFRDYLARKRQDGVFGNHLELQAIAEMYNRPVYIYTTDERTFCFILTSWTSNIYSLRLAGPLNLFQGMYDASNNLPIRLSYHYGNHYNSVRDPETPSVGVGLGLPGLNAEVLFLASPSYLRSMCDLCFLDLGI